MTTRPPGDAAVPAPRTPAPVRARPQCPRGPGAPREALALRRRSPPVSPSLRRRPRRLRTATSAAVRTPPGAVPDGHPPRRPAVPAAQRAAPPRSARPARRAHRPPEAAPRRRPRPARAGPPASASSPWAPCCCPRSSPSCCPAPTDGRSSGGPLDATALALTAQSSLLERAGRYRQLEQEVAQRRAELQQARDAEQAARAQVARPAGGRRRRRRPLPRQRPPQRYPVLTPERPRPRGDLRRALPAGAGRARRPGARGRPWSVPSAPAVTLAGRQTAWRGPRPPSAAAERPRPRPSWPRCAPRSTT